MNNVNGKLPKTCHLVMQRGPEGWFGHMYMHNVRKNFYMDKPVESVIAAVNELAKLYQAWRKSEEATPEKLLDS